MWLLASFVWRVLKKSASVAAKLWFVWVCIAILALVIWGMVATVQYRERKVLADSFSPSYLQQENMGLKRQWILSCINNGAAGVLGGATMSEAAIAACGTLGDKLYPEKDWEHVAMINWERSVLGSTTDE